MANEAKALTMLKTGQKTADRAKNFFSSIKRDLHIKMIVSLEQELEKKKDEIFELENIFIDTDKNAGRQAMTKAECQDNIEKIIQKEYECKLIQLELEAKKESFDRLFS